MAADIDIEKIIANKRLVVHFQPIISMNKAEMFGVESLIRGIGDNGELITPYALFGAAERAGVSFELDKLARILSIKAFSLLHRQNPKLILFVNFESKLIDSFEPGNYLFYGELKKAAIPYENVVLELKEDEIKSTSNLKRFCEHYRTLGFNIALDDFGVGQSAFDRISIARPDIIKIDRSLISRIEDNRIHQEIVGAICKMCHNIGAIALAEGVESIDETVCCTRLGASLMQGFYFAKPSEAPLRNDIGEKLLNVNIAYAASTWELQNEEKKFHEMATKVKSGFCSFVSEVKNMRHWNGAATPILDEHPNVEALYLIDKDDKQIGPTLIKRSTRSFYEPTDDGHDYSLKEYYARAKSDINGMFLTEPYLSLASGSLCRTYASKISILDESYVLCIDFCI